MKVENSNHSHMIMEKVQRPKNENLNKSEREFGKTFEIGDKKEEIKSDKVNKMLESIDEVKHILEQDLSVDNLNKYKEAIRSFLEYYTKNEMKMDYYFVKDSRTFMDKKVGIIQNINDKVDELTNEMLETNKGHLDTLYKMGEIKGLIVNLFV